MTSAMTLDLVKFAAQIQSRYVLSAQSLNVLIVIRRSIQRMEKKTDVSRRWRKRLLHFEISSLASSTENSSGNCTSGV
jgi:hypothetical protein